MVEERERLIWMIRLLCEHDILAETRMRVVIKYAVMVSSISQQGEGTYNVAIMCTDNLPLESSQYK